MNDSNNMQEQKEGNLENMMEIYLYKCASKGREICPYDDILKGPVFKTEFKYGLTIKGADENIAEEIFDDLGNAITRILVSVDANQDKEFKVIPQNPKYSKYGDRFVSVRGKEIFGYEPLNKNDYEQLILRISSHFEKRER